MSSGSRAFRRLLPSLEKKPLMNYPGPHEVWVSHLKEPGGSTTQTFIALGRHRVPRVSSSYFFPIF